MFKLPCVLMAGLLLQPLIANAEIFKCTDSKGMIKLQNFPCNIDTIGSTATAPVPPGASPSTPPNAAAAPGARGQPPVISGENADASKPPADAKPEPRIGMTRRQVRRLSWGEPVDIERSQTSEGEIEIWKYANNRTVQFGEDGRVSSFQR